MIVRNYMRNIHEARVPIHDMPTHVPRSTHIPVTGGDGVHVVLASSKLELGVEIEAW